MAEKPTNEDIGALFDSVEEVAQEAAEEALEETVQELEDAVQEDEEAEGNADDSNEASLEATEESDLVEVEWEGQLYEAPKEMAEALMRNSDYT